MADVASIIAGVVAGALAQGAPAPGPWYYPPPPYYRPVPPLYVPPHPQIKPAQPQQDAEDKAEEAEAKRATLDFCRRHPREYFCTRLSGYLEKHPELR